MKETILICEDEKELVKGLKMYLELEEYQVLSAYRGDEGYEIWQKHHPDLIILDINMPGMDGLEVAAKIREEADTPIIILTAKVSEEERLEGLEIGADDYITKPFYAREVVARVKAVLRRARGSGSLKEEELPNLVKAGDLKIDEDGYRVTREGKVIDLTPSEFAILVKLGKSPGRVFDRAQLLEATQGDYYAGYERAIDSHIKNLRAKLNTGEDSQQYIETVHGLGYRFRRD